MYTYLNTRIIGAHIAFNGARRAGETKKKKTKTKQERNLF